MGCSRRILQAGGIDVLAHSWLSVYLFVQKPQYNTTCHPGFLFPSCCFKSNIVYNIHIHLKVNQTSKVINTTF